MIYLDGFSGYGGFHLALERAGFKFDQCYFSEMDKHAIANYSYNYPNSIYAGLIQRINRATIPHIDLFTFGWPCQDNSIAGKRKGQSGGTRSGLLYEAVRIIDEFKPRHFIAENVLGLLSVNDGCDFVQSLEVLAYLNQSCPQYDIEMQLCNTRWVLPQNRERLFFIGHLRGTGSRQVFPIADGIGEVPKKGYGKDIAGCISTRNASGQCNFDGTTTLISANTKQGYEIATEGDSINFSVPNSKTRRGRVGKGVAQTLDTSCNQGVIQVNPSIESGGKQPYQQNRVYDSNGLAPALNSQQSDQHKVRIAGWHENENVVAAHRDDAKRSTCGEHVYHKETGILTTMTKAHQPKVITYGAARIRRLTPTECERLQGLPDGWTKYGDYDGDVKEISDTQRYRLCGNGVSVPIVEMIARKLYELNYAK